MFKKFSKTGEFSFAIKYTKLYLSGHVAVQMFMFLNIPGCKLAKTNFASGAYNS